MRPQRKSSVSRARRQRGQQLNLPEPVVDQIQARLRRVEGQVGAIQRMIAEKRDCHAIAQQLSAARAALSRAAGQLMAQSMAQCIQPNGSLDERELNDLADTFVRLLA